MNAVRFSGCDGGSIMEYVEDERCFSVRSAYASSPELLAKLRTIRVELETRSSDASALEGPSDRSAGPRRRRAGPAPAAPARRRMAVDGGRARCCGGERIIGALVVRRKQPGEFSDETVELLETFASQSALAIGNAQLFRELERKTAELEVVSQHKSEFLASMSHELRTPLNAVIGFSEVLLERMFGELNDRQDEYLRDILELGQAPAASCSTTSSTSRRSRPVRWSSSARRSPFAARSSTACRWCASGRPRTASSSPSRSTRRSTPSTRTSCGSSRWC